MLKIKQKINEITKISLNSILKKFYPKKIFNCQVITENKSDKLKINVKKYVN